MEEPTTTKVNADLIRSAYDAFSRGGKLVNPSLSLVSVSESEPVPDFESGE